MTMTMINFHSIKQKFNLNRLDWLLFVLVITFFMGLIFGSISIKNSENFLIEKINDCYINYLQIKETLSSFYIFLNTLLIVSTAIVFSFFTGLCAIGVPIVTFIPFCTGALIGIVSGYIYETYLLKGLGYCGIIIFPTAAIAVGAIIYSCKDSINMSKNMLNLLVNRRSKNEITFKNYCIKFSVFILISVFAAILQVILTRLFINLFDFQVV